MQLRGRNGGAVVQAGMVWLSNVIPVARSHPYCDLAPGFGSCPGRGYRLQLLLAGIDCARSGWMVGARACENHPSSSNYRPQHLRRRQFRNALSGWRGARLTPRRRVTSGKFHAGGQGASRIRKWVAAWAEPKGCIMSRFHSTDGKAPSIGGGWLAQVRQTTAVHPSIERRKSRGGTPGKKPGGGCRHSSARSCANAIRIIGGEKTELHSLLKMTAGRGHILPRTAGSRLRRLCRMEVVRLRTANRNRRKIDCQHVAV